MKFNSELVYELDDMVSYTRAFIYRRAYDKSGKVPSKYVLNGYKDCAFTFILSIICFINSIITLIVEKITMCGLFIAFGSMSLFLGIVIFRFSNYKLMGKNVWKQYNKKGIKITYMFSDNEVQEITDDSTHTQKYSTINSIYEDDERFHLFINDANSLTIRKTSFTIGDSKEFRNFIAEKTGLKVVYINDTTK